MLDYVRVINFGIIIIIIIIMFCPKTPWYYLYRDLASDFVLSSSIKYSAYRYSRI